jgi:hypothetical protein
MNNATPEVPAWTLKNDLFVYERAQEAAYHTDTVMWEITAIIWGANTVLLGFMIEAIINRRAPLIILLSIVGMALTGFVARVCCVAKTAKEIGYGICKRIEVKFPPDLRLLTRIDERYPKGMARGWVYGVSILFGVAWLAMLLYALLPLLCRVGSLL